MQKSEATVVLLGTEAVPENDANDPAGDPAPSDAAALVASAEVPPGVRLQTEDVARIDACDIDWAVWRALAARVAYHIDRSDVAGVVVGHGPATLAETAYLLQRVLAPDKPVVLTTARRSPTQSPEGGLQNVSDAIRVATWPGARGVVAVLGGMLLGALDASRRRTDAHDDRVCGNAGPLGVLNDGIPTLRRGWPRGEPLGLGLLPRQPPRVAIVASHGDADGGVVEALRAQGVDGIVVVDGAGGRLPRRLEAALREAERQGGVRILRCVCGVRDAMPAPGDTFECIALSPGQARIELLLRLRAAEA